MRQTLQQARKVAKKTQKEIAIAVGISERFYRHIEAGTRGTSETNWLKMYDLFERKIPLDKLMFKTPKAANSDGQTQETKQQSRLDRGNQRYPLIIPNGRAQLDN